MQESVLQIMTYFSKGKEYSAGKKNRNHCMTYSVHCTVILTLTYSRDLGINNIHNLISQNNFSHMQTSPNQQWFTIQHFFIKPGKLSNNLKNFLSPHFWPWELIWENLACWIFVLSSHSVTKLLSVLRLVVSLFKGKSVIASEQHKSKSKSYPGGITKSE